VADFVWIHNPDTGGVALQPADAVTQIWVKKGFALVDPDLAEASGALGFPVTELRQLPEDYVRDVATRRTPAPPPEKSRDANPEEAPDPPPKAAPTRRSTPAKEA
jgi:hypothetical protein